jgi:hypothetical protein
MRLKSSRIADRPVFFVVRGPWSDPESAATPLGKRVSNIIGEILVVALLVAAGLVAWRNVRMGRGDRKGAWRVLAPGW